MTVNGKPAGPVHQDGFNEFRFDVSALLKFDAENLLEMDVSKVERDIIDGGVFGAQGQLCSHESGVRRIALMNDTEPGDPLPF